MGMFRDMKDVFGVVRSDELKDLKRKADAQPKTSMMDGVKMANQAMDQAAEFQATYGGPAGANPFANATAYSQTTPGSATVTAIQDTGTRINESPVVELDLMVTVAGPRAVPGQAPPGDLAGGHGQLPARLGHHRARGSRGPVQDHHRLRG